MYQKPRVERFGTFRELTQAGTLGQGDGAAVLCNIGNDVCGTPEFPCQPGEVSGR